MRKSTRLSTSSSSSYEGSSGNARAWIIFLTGLFISTFFGGAVRAFLSPQQLSVWVERLLVEKDPKFYLNFDHLEFTLAEGMWPKFGFYVKGLKLTSKDPCISQSQLSISEVYFPIRLSSFYEGNVSFSDIEAKEVEFIYKEPVCNSRVSIADLTPPRPVQPEATEVEERSSRILNEVRDFVENRFLKELANSRQWFYTLSFDKFHLYKSEPELEGLIFDKFRMDLNRYKQKVFVSTQVAYKSKKYLLDDFKPLDLEFVLSQKDIHIKGQGRFKEGELNLHGNLNIPTEEFKLHFASNYFPVGEIVKSIHTMKGMTEGINPRLLWFSCKASAEGLIGDYKNTQVKANSCGLRGEAGKLFTEEIIFYPFLDRHIEPFTADVENFSLKYFSEIVGGSNLDSTFTSWGVLDGQLEFNNDQLRFIGALKKVEAIFSREGKKRLQLIREARGEVSWQNKRVSGIIKEMDITGGEFAGVISFNLDENFKNGIVQTKIEKVKLSRPVVRLYLNIESTPLQIFGKMSIKDGLLEEWQGYLGMAELRQANYKAEKIKVDTKYSGHIWDLGIKVDSINVPSGSTMFENIEKLLLIEGSPEKFDFSKINASLQIHKDSGEWKELSAREENLAVILSSGGKWEGVKKVIGWLNVEKEQKKWMPWELTGSLKKVEFSPSTQLLKAIRPQNSTVKLDDKMSAGQRREAFKKIMSRRKGAKLKGFTEKVVDTAKKWIPDFSNPKAENKEN